MEGSPAAGAGAGAGQDQESALPFVFLGLVVVAISSVLAWRGLGSHFVAADEAASIALGRSIAQDPISLFTGFFKTAVDTGRGVERAVPVLAGLADLTGASGNTQLQVLRGSMCLVQGLVAVPTFALARELGLSRWQALVPAAVGASGACAFFGIFLLSSSIGVLAFMVFLWLLFRSLRDPGPVNDLALVMAVAALAVVRLGWAPLAACALPAAIAWYWLSRPAGESIFSFLRGLPRTVFRDHALVAILALVTIVALILFGASPLVRGSYLGGYLTIVGESVGWDQVARNAPEIVAHLAIGLAFLPFVLALAWIARNLLFPIRPADGAYAWLIVSLVLLFGFVYMRWAAIANTAIEDRYLAVLVPPLAVAGSLAVFRHPRPSWWVVILAAALTTWLGAVGFRVPRLGPFDFFTAPTSLLFDQVVLGRGSTAFGFGGTGLAVAVLATAGLLSVAVVLAAGIPRRRIANGFLSIVLAGVLIFQLAAMEYPARKFTELLGMKELQAHELEFVDRQVDGDVAVLAPDGLVPPSVAAQLPSLQTFNRSVRGTWILGVGPATPEFARVDPDSGLINHPPSPPRRLLFKSGFSSFGIAGRELSVPPSRSFVRLLVPEQPLRVDWLIAGASADGYAVPGSRLQLTAFSRGRRGLCLTGNVLSDPRLPGPVQYSLIGNRYRSSGSVQGAVPSGFRARVRSGPSESFTLRSTYGPLPDGSSVGAGLFDVALAPCR